MQQTFKKQALMAAVAASIGGATLPAHAVIPGLPGEALLVPFLAQDIGRGDDVYSAVILNTPASVGFETVIGNYTMPNILRGVDEYSAPAEMTIAWTAFDRRSEHLRNGTFTMTPDDIYFWSPGDGGPGGTALDEFIGYVVFSDGTPAVKRGVQASGVALTGSAWMILEDSCEALGDPSEGLCPETSGMALALPVIAMADGVDNCQDRALPSWPAQQSGDFSCLATDQRNLAITYENNVVATTTGTNGRPEHVSPLATGIRMQGVFTGDADGVSSFYEQILLTGLYSQWDGNWTHIFWFSENSDDRSAEVYATNDEEVRVSCSAIPMPNELHGYVYADEDNRVYDLIEGFTIETLNTDKWFGDACLTQNGIPNNRDPESNQCAEICGVGDIWQYPSGRGDLPDGFTAHAPGIGTMEYWLTAGPFDTSTAMAFSFLSDLDWDRDYNVPVGSDMEIYSGGYQIMQELGGFKGP